MFTIMGSRRKRKIEEIDRFLELLEKEFGKRNVFRAVSTAGQPKKEERLENYLK